MSSAGSRFLSPDREVYLFGATTVDPGRQGWIAGNRGRGAHALESKTQPQTRWLRSAFASTRAVLAVVEPDQLDAPTPRASWDVRALIDHGFPPAGAGPAQPNTNQQMSLRSRWSSSTSSRIASGS